KELCSLDQKLHGTLDLAAYHLLGIEFARAKNFPQDGPNFVVMLAEATCHCVDSLRRRIVLDEIAPDFSPNKLRARRLFQQSNDDIVAVQWSSSAHERFRTCVIVERRKPKLLRAQVDTVTSERSR